MYISKHNVTFWPPYKIYLPTQFVVLLVVDTVTHLIVCLHYVQLKYTELSG